jgi:hypothetical protein
MAFQSVRGGSGAYKVFSKMADGESITGYLVDLVPNKNYPQNVNLVIQTEDGQNVEIATAGDLRYYVQDALDASNAKQVYKYVLTKIIRNGSRITKKGQKLLHRRSKHHNISSGVRSNAV